jgi:hypothetical protein
MFTAAAIYQLIDEKATLPGSKAPFTLDTLLQDAPARKLPIGCPSE